MEETLATPPTFKLNFSDQVHCVEFSPFEWSHHLICIALTHEIVIGTVKFQEEDEAIDEIAYNPLTTIHHDTRPHAIAWSPETSLSVIPKVVKFCVAGADFKIRLYTSNLDNKNNYEILDNHRDYINAVSYEPEGEYLVSVSDDHTCKLWDIKEEHKCVITYYLTSPGMSVCWHNEKPGKLMVAEKNGIIRMYNVKSQQALMSLDSGVAPLTSAEWGIDPMKIISLAAGELLFWDVTRLSQPLESFTLHIDGGKMVKFSPLQDNILASIGQPDNLLKVTNIKSKQVLLCGRMSLIGGLTWHQKLPFICTGNNRELNFWRINFH
ncbi:nucleoporin Nup37 [Prorops nasuta]|uniref:nucleoporin Nup37 n=1 Tax=Prorops nasuta TaxID=863751 RepID=UPI0034CF5D66